MDNITILDADSIVYGSCCVLNEDDPVEYALHNVKQSLSRVKEDTEADEFIPIVSGHGNFRHDIYPEYKANRRDQPRPPYLKEARQYVIDHWDGMFVDGLEADDVCGIMMYNSGGEDRLTLAHIDKDLDMLEGHHYNYRTGESYYVTESEAYRKFHYQMLTGDSTDNIPGLYKLTGKKAQKKYKQPIDDMEDPQDMWQHVMKVYEECAGDEWEDVRETLNITAKLLWIKRDENEELEW